MNRNIRGLMDALRQSINEAILESNDVAVAMAALKRTGKNPVFTIDVCLQDPAAEMPFPGEPEAQAAKQETGFSVPDIEFLAALGISDPSWYCSSSKSDHE